MLRNGATPARVRPRRRIGGVHDTVDTRLLRDRLLAIALWHWRDGRYTGDAAPVPDAPDVVARYDLSETACLNVPDLNEPTVE